MVAQLKNPIVDIIVPIYNVSNYLKRCLNSIQNQTFKAFRVLLIDDGSTDTSRHICYEFVKKDKRFKYFHKENGGLSDARNYGLNQSNSKYVIFIDSDDYIHKDYVSELLNNIQEYNSDVAVCGFFRVNEQGDILEQEDTISNKNSLSGRSFLKKTIEYGNNTNSIVAWNKIYKRKIFNNVRFSKGKYFEDQFIFTKLYWKINKVSFVNIPLYYYVQRQGSIMQSNLNEKKIMDTILFRQERIDFFNHRDSQLYLFAIQDLKNWLVVLAGKYHNQLNSKLFKQLQNLYRYLCQLSRPQSFKYKIKDCIFSFNLRLSIILFEIKK